MKIIQIALNTFRESVRDRVLYNLVLFVLLIVIASVVMGRMAVGQEAKIIIDVGLSAMTVFGVLIAIFIGVGLVSKEIEKRTIANILSKPVRRWELLIGKYVGLCLTLGVNTALMAVAITMALIYVKGWVKGETFGGTTDWPMGWLDVAQLWPAAYLIFLQLAIMTAVALLFSCFSSPALSSLFALLVFLIGRWSPDLKLIAETSGSVATRIVCRALYYLMPNLANFNYINETAYGQAIPAKLIASGSLYALCYIAALIGASVMIFERRDFK